MYVVIFKAELGAPDDEYYQAAEKLRKMALEEFGCLEFTAVSEGKQEIALSYWPDEESIKRWKACSDHVLAQESGRQRWYKSYSVEVAEIGRTYSFAK